MAMERDFQFAPGLGSTGWGCLGAGAYPSEQTQYKDSAAWPEDVEEATASQEPMAGASAQRTQTKAQEEGSQTRGPTTWSACCLPVSPGATTEASSS